MSDEDGFVLESENGATAHGFEMVKRKLQDKSKQVAQKKELLAIQTKEIISKHADKIAKQAEQHESLLSKVTHLLGVLGFGGFCFLMGARPRDIPYVYCFFYIAFVPLRWIYYRFKKWHYYLLDFCYYANTIFLVQLLLYPTSQKLFMVCFSFAEGPLAWALIVWRCSLVFSSFDKLVSVLIHLLPGLTFFTIRWWNPSFVDSDQASEDKHFLLKWLFMVPLFVYTLWQLLYFLIVNVLRRQRFLRDPDVMTSYRELSKKAQKANNLWWRLSGLLGDQNRLLMFILLQGVFTVATMALTVPIFLSYELSVVFQVLKVAATVWNGGNFLLDVMPRQYILKEKSKSPIGQSCATCLGVADAS